MKAKLLIRLRKEAKREYYIVDTKYDLYRYQVKEQGQRIDEYINRFSSLDHAVKYLKSLRIDYIESRMRMLRRKVLDL